MKKKKIIRIKRRLKKLEKIQPYFSPNYNYQVDTTAGPATTLNYTMTDDGYDYVTIRTLITKINEIIDNIKEQM